MVCSFLSFCVEASTVVVCCGYKRTVNGCVQIHLLIRGLNPSCVSRWENTDSYQKKNAWECDVTVESKKNLCNLKDLHHIVTERLNFISCLLLWNCWWFVGYPVFFDTHILSLVQVLLYHWRNWWLPKCQRAFIFIHKILIADYTAQMSKF